MKLVVFFVLLVVHLAESEQHPPRDKAKQWALLVAGSNTYFNYRHQADICHAYHIMRDHGIPEDNIVVMMFDDIAYNKYNPTPGVIINRPNGTDVYKGVKKDYTGMDVNPRNFLNVLQGNHKAVKGIGTGRVINSGPDDHVFVYFADHGAPGVIAFPNMSLLHSRDLNTAIMKMHQENRYKQMVMYVEACESGSMFYKQLPDDINVYAVTAANRTQSSYACYLDKWRRAFLGDLFSVKWMENSDATNLRTESLQKQYDIVKVETNRSHVEQFGDLSIAREMVGQFQGDKKPRNRTVGSPDAPLTAVPSHDARLTLLRKHVEWAQTEEELSQAVYELQQALKERELIASTMLDIARMVSTGPSQARSLIKARREITDWDCYEPLVHHFGHTCFNFQEYEHALRHLYALVNMCEEKIPHEVIRAAIDSICAPKA